ncbi:MAG: (deoxy)nucleoside triphosphate pyrophosphohydrolase [Treponema sp.]|uniref:(deoxy)nucleoside triphosphate pyrophosphohydrolase n=1 Tax=Treponema sp. TaxID=166 RepID=UPI003FA2DF74
MKQSVVGIVRKDNRFLLGRREPGGDVGGLWEFPGGKCEAGETHEQTLIREYEEELAVKVSVGRFIAQKHFKNERRDFDLFAYEVMISESQTCVSSVHSELQWFSLDELQNLPVVPSDALFIPALRDFYQV